MINAISGEVRVDTVMQSLSFASHAFTSGSVPRHTSRRFIALHTLCLQEKLPGDRGESRGQPRRSFDPDSGTVSPGGASPKRPDPDAEAKRNHSRDAPQLKRAGQA